MKAEGAEAGAEVPAGGNCIAEFKTALGCWQPVSCFAIFAEFYTASPCINRMSGRTIKA
jgi:hypothetical protein